MRQHPEYLEAKAILDRGGSLASLAADWRASSRRPRRAMSRETELPRRVGPVEFAMFGSMVEARCPSELAPLMRKAGGMWEPAGRRWLLMRRRVGPLIRELRRTTDPLFRHAGLDLDQ